MSSEREKKIQEELLQFKDCFDESLVKLTECFFAIQENGLLNKETFIKFYKEHFRKQNDDDADSFCELAFEAYDTDKTGFIDYEEFLCACIFSTKAPLRDKLSLAYEIYDHKKDNYVYYDQFKRVLESIFKLMKIYNEASLEEKAQYFFKKIDTNGDKKISKEEFINTCLSDDFMLYTLVPVFESPDE